VTVLIALSIALAGESSETEAPSASSEAPSTEAEPAPAAEPAPVPEAAPQPAPAPAPAPAAAPRASSSARPLDLDAPGPWDVQVHVSGVFLDGNSAYPEVSPSGSTALGGSVGYAVTPWLHPFVSVSALRAGMGH
jgi:hypothetical protein